MKASAAAWDLLSASLRGARVLIVDDDRVTCAHMAKMIKEWETEPFTAQTLSEALRLHKEGKPDLVLLDVMMPHVDGYKMAQMFKREAPFVPIILLTALDDIDSKRRALSAGADEFLTKPVNALELQIRMSSMLRIKRLADELEKANKSLAAMATTDALTQVANRRHFEQKLADEFQRWKRYKHPFTCIMVDVDHFKKVNDTYGHQVGDKVLVHVAAAIKASTRATDFVARYGGEEFAILTPETPAISADVVAERIRDAIARRTADRSEAEGIPAVTASLGLASTDLAIETAEDLVRRADEALYRAKREGRNRAVRATDPSSTIAP